MKRLVDLDDLLHYLLEVNEVDIGDDYYRNTFNESLNKEFENYYNSVTPQVQVGQTVWVISGSDYYGYKIKECIVTKMQVKVRRTFTVHEPSSAYNGNFTKNSIGKTVFFTKEDAENTLNLLELNTKRRMK